MRNLKKLLALVLAMVMAFSLMLSAGAVDYKDYPDKDSITEEFKEAVQVLTGLKVFQGDEGGFRPGDTITRAEVAAIIYRIATGDVEGKQVKIYADYGNFTDVPRDEWFAGYVGYCANAGYIKGHGGYFNPYDSVTGYEVLAMVLRAVGYDKNGEFEGATWQTNVSALSTQLGILDDVKSTHYGDRLYEPSRRDVVASLLFRTAAYVHMVEYTPMAGYNKYEDMLGDTLRPTLGQKIFGLTHTTGIIVGNQDTGEDYTKLGELYINGVQNSNGSYAYESYAELDGNSTNITFSYNTETGIDMFGHKFKIWYDYNSDSAVQEITWTAGGGGSRKVDDEYKTVYATFDKATLAEHVYATDSNITSTANGSGAVGLRTAAKAAGFANTNDTRWSVMYSRIDPTAVQTIGASHLGDGTTGLSGAPNSSEVETYYLVSNNDGKTVDVAVSVYNELARIDKKDTTANTKTLTLGNTTGVTTQLFETATPGHILERKLTPNSVKDLGATVLATAIIGSDKVLNDTTATDWNKSYYKLENAITEENQIVASAYSTSTTNKWNNDQNDAISIDLADGTTLKRSGIMNGTSADAAAAPATIHMISKCVTELTNANMIFGQNLTIYKDKTGRFIGVKTGTDFSFLYGTFADYEIGGLGTGTIKYAITGVNWDGEIVENHVMTSITAGDTTTRYRDNTLANGYSTNATGGHFVMPLTKKYLADTAPGSGVGNQILAGRNMGLAIDDAGNVLAPVTGSTPNNYNVIANGKTLAKFNGGTNWTLTAADAANGFARVDTKNVPGDTAVSRLITNETKFIVVTGSGTADLKVDVYTGISEFLGGATSVHIDNNANATPGTDVDSTFYLTRADRYNNMDTTQNEIIDTVILSNTQISGRSTSTLYFSNSQVPTGTTLNGEYEQYVMYNDGVKGYYFLESVTDSTPTTTVINSTNKATTLQADAFYTLRQTKTVNGQPVYAAQVVAAGAGGVAGDGVRTANGNFCWSDPANTSTDVPYSYVATSNLSTAYFGGTIAKDPTTGIYRDTTGGTVYRVDNAKVIDLTGGVNNGGTGTVSHAEFTSVLDLNNAVSSGWGIMDVAIMNSGLDVSVIYVLSVKAPADT